MAAQKYLAGQVRRTGATVQVYISANMVEWIKE
jgi:hypothetical protein